MTQRGEKGLCGQEWASKESCHSEASRCHARSRKDIVSLGGARGRAIAAGIGRKEGG